MPPIQTGSLIYTKIMRKYTLPLAVTADRT